MSQPEYRVRRATLDDVKTLSALWLTMRFPTAELEKRITEFQIAESADGKLLGTLGLQIAGRQGRLHSEAFTDFALADALRPLLWDRLQAVANNHGLVRLWTQERTPFWNHIGLQAATPEFLQKLPDGWKSSSGDWLTLKLREENPLEAISLDKEFALFMESEKERTQQAFRQARIFKYIVTFMCIVLAIGVFVLAIVVLTKTVRPPSGAVGQ